jgi:hypothetical protein
MGTSRKRPVPARKGSSGSGAHDHPAPGDGFPGIIGETMMSVYDHRNSTAVRHRNPRFGRVTTLGENNFDTAELPGRKPSGWST